MRSDKLKQGIETLPHRALLRASGLEDADFKKPFIGVANSFNDVIPGHVHLRKLSEEVKRGIKDAGGVPFEWGVPGVCDGIAMFVEMRLSLPSREHIAENIEIMAMSHSMDAWVGVTNCDKITPGMLMAAGRINIPSVILTGGPMKPGEVDGKKVDLISTFEIVGQIKNGLEVSNETIRQLECESCPGEGSCAGLFTANTMACMTEVLGMSLTGCATSLAVSEKKMQIAYESGKKAVELALKGIKPRDVVTKESLQNAVMVDMAIGGSSNTALHLPAIAEAFDVDLTLDDFDNLSKTTPNICKIRPSGPYFMEDIENSGGIPGVLKQLKLKLQEAKTINEKSIIEIANEASVTNEEIIRPISNPFFEEGGIAVLKGNLANSSVVKQTAVDPDIMVHSGPAKVFTSEEEMLEAVEKGKIVEGDVVVLKYMGVKGAPGMPEMLTPTSVIMGAGFKKVVLLTDGRFSGGTRGPCIGHIEPEAYDGGTIGIIEDGDIINIDIPNRKLDVELSEEEIRARKKNMVAPERKMTPMLRRIREHGL
ncbi:dihydroxy-acid dehydratase [archaeon D22]|nr:dihydroxy-acid dehydratase [archaeon D22]